MVGFVVSLRQDGWILSQGTLSEALKSNNALLKEVKAREVEVTKVDEIIDEVLPETTEGKGGKLIVKEEIAKGHVSCISNNEKNFFSCFSHLFLPFLSFFSLISTSISHTGQLL